MSTPARSQRKLHEPVDDFDMGARRDLRHHPAIGGVLGDLAHDLVRQNFTGTAWLQLDDGGGGFVASGLNPENAHDAPYRVPCERFPCKWIRLRQKHSLAAGAQFGIRASRITFNL